MRVGVASGVKGNSHTDEVLFNHVQNQAAEEIKQKERDWQEKVERKETKKRALSISLMPAVTIPELWFRQAEEPRGAGRRSGLA